MMALGEALRGLARRIARPSLTSRLLPFPVPSRLIISPKDLRIADAGLAQDIYSGRFFLAGKMIETGGGDPFTLAHAPIGWQRELHGFGWLRHLEADGGELARKNATALLNDWLSHRFSRRSSPAWQIDVAARRLITWLCHSVPIVETMTPRQYQNWLKSIGFHIRFLKLSGRQAPEGLPSLTLRIALAYAVLCADGMKRYQPRAMRLLDEELAGQIADDGMHRSRNPAVLAELLALLLPLRQAHARLGIQPSQRLVSSIDRMMLALKFFRLGDGNLARFNGVSANRSDLVATLMHYDDAIAASSEPQALGGYQRLTAGTTVLIADTGRPPQGAASAEAHAGTLSFEVSSENTLLLVNCGAPPFDMTGRRPDAVRATAAHNTLTIRDTSSSRIYAGRLFASLLGGWFVSGPSKVTCERRTGSGSTGFVATHDGYRKTFDAIHERSLFLSFDGNRIVARDRLKSPSGGAVRSARDAAFQIRFHLPPSVSAGTMEDGSVVLMCGRGLTWRFACKEIRPVIEESAFFASISGTKRTMQIVLNGNAGDTPEVSWQLVRETLASHGDAG
ncbi:MAG: heparinase II/III family protein [Nitratireductor sp.]|nr:heparinase II/III family protein [Nitratireductor sp.]